MTPGAPAPPASSPRTTSTGLNPHPAAPTLHCVIHLPSCATEDTMRPFEGPGFPLREVTTLAGIVNKVMGGAVHRPGMTLVDGLWPAS